MSAPRASLLLLAIPVLLGSLPAQEPKPLEPADGERLRTIRDEALAATGRHVAYRITTGRSRRDAPPGEDSEEASLVLLRCLETGAEVQEAGATIHAFSPEGRFHVTHLREPRPRPSQRAPQAGRPEAAPAAAAPGAGTPAESPRRRRGGGRTSAPPQAAPASGPLSGPGRRPTGHPLVLRDLCSGDTRRIEGVRRHEFGPKDRHLVLHLSLPSAARSGLFVLDLEEGPAAPLQPILRGDVEPRLLAWTLDGSTLIAIAAEPGPTDFERLRSDAFRLPEVGLSALFGVRKAPAQPRASAPPWKVWRWQPGRREAEALSISGIPEGRMLSGDGARLERTGRLLYVETVPVPAPEAPKVQAAHAADPPAAKPTVTVWHWLDDEIPTQRSRRNASAGRAPALIDLGTGEFRVLGDERLAGLRIEPGFRYAIGSDDDPYLRERTWDRARQDHYLIDLETGARWRIARRAAQAPRFGPRGSSLLIFEEGTWWSVDPATRTRTDLCRPHGIPLEFDELTGDARGGPVGALPGTGELLVSDSWDIWAVPGEGRPARNLTRIGRTGKIRFRPARLPGEDEEGLPLALVLHGVAEDTKEESLWVYDADSGTVRVLLRAAKDMELLARTAEGTRHLLRIQDSAEAPDLWIAGPRMDGLVRISDSNPWLREHRLPRAELVSWASADGQPLQGILLRPVEAVPGTRHPLIVQIYEQQSQNLHVFRAPGMGLNPQAFVQKGYAVLLPDIVYEIGRPGLSALKCTVPAVQRVVDLGVADPARVGLCGHSWGGYETAFIVTQTRLFRAAVAGAPVVNMSSAYNGIRWESGLPRQFQYEVAQSRIGGHLWELRDRFIENSPIFHLDRVKTPILVVFGNEDGAVPWYQGIELFLAMRRLGKPCIFLEYAGEGHSLRRPENLADHTERLHAFFDHHLRDAPAPPWLLGPGPPAPLEAAPASSPPVTDPAR
jgi:dienelactone hydrolase